MGWGVADAGDVVWCLWLAPRQIKVLLRKQYDQYFGGMSKIAMIVCCGGTRDDE